MRSVLFLTLVALVAATGTAIAAEVTLNPVADAPVFAHPTYLNRNMGSQTYGYWGFYNYTFRTFCRYDCSTVTGAVSKVELNFRLMQNNYATGKMWACKVNATWAENTITWANQPAHDSTTAGRILDIDWLSGNGPHRVTCTSAANTIVQGWATTPATNYGLVLRKNPESGNVPRCYPYLRESSYPGVQLIVTFTSAVEPASVGKVKALFK
ncbi:MAG: DNRLRE domain-containing protein [Candidatus Coatesbacteria bacterium]|nr:MAG: DNRLRE domain-containing protein [Candidatus Coatesbacteria bacterium]